MSEWPLEVRPSEAQQVRLDAFLHELARACRRQAIRVVERGGELHIIDVLSGHLIGVGLETYEGENGLITSIQCDGSILDGVWLIETDDGRLVEQRELARPEQVP